MLLSTGPPSLKSKLLNLLITVAVITLFLHTRRLTQQRPHQDHPVAADIGDAGGRLPEEQYLTRLASECDLSKDTTWMAWQIQHSEELPDWVSSTNVHLDFHSQKPTLIDLEKVKPGDIQVKKSLKLPVHTSPHPGQVHASELLIGISTAYSRIADDDFAMITAWARWLTTSRRHSNGASLIVMLDQALDSQVGDIDRKLQASGIDAYVTTTEEPMSMARRYYELTRILKTFGANLAANGQQKKFYGLIDDDIFFPSLSYLLDRLLTYNSNDELYVGLPSERADWEMDGKLITTYGGGAIFLTLPAIMEVPRLPCFGQDESGQPVRAKSWDSLLQDCLAKHSSLRMHVLPGFYSPSDVSYTADVDSYETGLQPLLLHHSQARHGLNINKAHLVADICGEACFMQRYIFKDNFVLVNGVSITEYPDGLLYEEKKADSVDSQGESSKLDIPDRLRLEEEEGERKIWNWKGRRNVWKLMDSAVGKDGAVWQAYVKKAVLTPQTAEQDNSDSVIVLVWQKGDASRWR